MINQCVQTAKIRLACVVENHMKSMTTKYNAISAINKKGKIIHIGAYSDRDEATLKRIKDNLKDFCPQQGEWKLWGQIN